MSMYGTMKLSSSKMNLYFILQYFDPIATLSLLHCIWQVAYHTPPRFPVEVTEHIRKGASLLFKQMGLRDFARIDGWFLPTSSNSKFSGDKFGKTDYGTILYTDINLVKSVTAIAISLVMSLCLYLPMIVFHCWVRLVGWSRLAFCFNKLQRYFCYTYFKLVRSLMNSLCGLWWIQIV